MPLRFFGRHRETIRDITTLFAVGISAFAVINVYSEASNRRDQNCHVFERQERVAVQQVIGTYEYLDGIPQSEWGKPFTKAIINNIPQIRREALASAAPPYCDAPGIGEKEPGLLLPKPHDYSRMLRP